MNSTCDGCINEEKPLCVKYCVYGAIKAVRENAENKEN